MTARFAIVLSVVVFLLQGCMRCPLKKKSEVETDQVSEIIEKDIPKVNVRFIFNMCNDVEAMRNFYSDLLGMAEDAFYSTEEFGWVSYPCEGVYLMFFYGGEDVVEHSDWAWQPGYEGGSLPVSSWAIEIPEQDFAATIKRLQESEIRTFSEAPQWRQESYWGFSVMDPMGNTIEVYTSPKEKPESEEWSGK